jgi:hypothetical protein
MRGSLKIWPADDQAEIAAVAQTKGIPLIAQESDSKADVERDAGDQPEERHLGGCGVKMVFQQECRWNVPKNVRCDTVDQQRERAEV